MKNGAFALENSNCSEDVWAYFVLYEEYFEQFKFKRREGSFHEYFNATKRGIGN
jgi:hypothetical protein